MSWSIVQLGDLAEFRNGINYNQKNFGTGIKVIGVVNFQNYIKPRYNELEEVNPEGVVKDEDILRDNDILFVRSNGNKDLIGRSLFIESPPEPITFSGFCIRTRFTSNQVFPRFFAYLFRSDLIRKTLSAYGGGTNIANLNQKILSRLQVSLPPLVTQERIADILSTYDRFIDNNNRRISLLEESIHLLYKEWFVRSRFPGYESVKVVDGIPEGWEITTIGNILLPIPRKKRIKKADYLSSGTIPTIDQGSEFIGGYTSEIEACHETPLPVVIFGDHTRIIKFVDFPFASGGDGTQILTPEENTCDIYYFYCALKSLDISNYAYARHFKYLKEQKILIPPSHLKNKFRNFSESII